MTVAFLNPVVRTCRAKNMEGKSARKKPTYAVHDCGLIMSESFNQLHLTEALNYIPNDDDIFICTYPKCGTTWMQCILYMMKNKGKSLEVGENVNHFIPHLECDGKGTLALQPRPWVIKTHLPYHLMPKSSTAKYIYIARNPKDCCVSYYHHTKGFGKYYHFEDGTFDDFFELFIEGQVDFNDYFDHLLSWIAHKNDPNFLFLLYEELKTDITGCIKKVGQFLGGQFLESSLDPSILDKIVQNSSFEAMKATPSIWSSEIPKQFASFIRKGKVGDWRFYFSEEQSRRMDQEFIDKLSGTEAEHLWDCYNC